jgi:hypothetical protein
MTLNRPKRVRALKGQLACEQTRERKFSEGDYATFADFVY